jgi:small-conductance mechanosensitive channel
MQRVKATAREVGVVAAFLEPMAPLIGWVAPQAVANRATVVVVTVTAVVRAAESAAPRRQREVRTGPDKMMIRRIPAVDTPTWVTSSLPAMFD